jgi:ankyrin repeat protein
MPQDTSLHKAANNGDVAEIKSILETPPEEGEEAPDVNGPGAAERRPLHRAAGAGHLQATEFLLEKGAQIDIVSNINFTV